MPGQQLRPDDKAPYYVVPPLIGTSSYNQNMTGYSLLKHVQIDYTGSLDAEFKGATPAIQFRYADILLNYAEALAELDGVGNAQKIIDALQPLRDRVGMPPVDLTGSIIRKLIMVSAILISIFRLYVVNAGLKSL